MTSKVRFDEPIRRYVEDPTLIRYNKWR